ncbi:unannotated protein [freshwater metagenome]|uniref:Unannotated protein n=1 Tax=freshwater metagenome TaxID=449393 RepID=A0A6J7M2Z2_9ZZZZ|nr:hypothetical protein [Actinomycetota bacterium]MSW62740.1 hypothetical protein [Actinomycetota bacterium]MSX89828.1 hypothetical protein [Actinomycetota bacterium]MSZ63800.1 hypothetical protein [Actinomycetota bacterium]MTA57429.1 hypothetical protein [Actinomycetota bacterium]
MNFIITKGQPTAQELVAINAAMAQHKREELEPVIRRSAFGLPQLRKPFNNNFRFGARSN